ncbi:dihydroorotase [Microbaculum marinisediminis]|uniref:Dihydroorotase n=1 Tax=Microbaculum marinisediminis TaxID=2931392 RepID=A0AAW5QZ36_9HYPH|nr:dihydroorotase [Microbaculum sp. A6E488]MCT8973187.1 dihydroorotase [Microbaculum sp. A6E488]
MPVWGSPERFEPEKVRPTGFHNVRLIDPSIGRDEIGGLLIDGGRIADVGPHLKAGSFLDGTEVIDGGAKVLAPGLIDMQVFTGEPGFEHRETIASASRAAAAGGVTTMICMPDTDPVIHDVAMVDYVQRLARDTAIVRLLPMGALTRDLAGTEMTEIGLMSAAGAVAFTNGRRAITNAQTMRRVLTYAGDFDALIVHHPEDPDLVGEGVMHEGEMATRLGLKGIPVEAETVMLSRDLKLVGLAGGRYHAAQLSAGRSLTTLRRAKERGIKVTAGVSINNLALNENDIGTYRTFVRLSPPLRSEDDRMALVAALAEGLIDVIVSSHDPHDVETKRHPFAEAEVGAIGLETLLSAALRLHHSGDVPLMRLIDAMSTRPAAILGLEGGSLEMGRPADLVFFDPDEPWIVDAGALSSRSKNTPFEDARMQGRVLRTIVAGRTVYDYGSD